MTVSLPRSRRGPGEEGGGRCRRDTGVVHGLAAVRCDADPAHGVAQDSASAAP